MTEYTAIDPGIITENEQQMVAELVCEFFEQTRDGLEPNYEDFINQLPTLKQRELFETGAAVSLLLGARGVLAGDVLETP